MPRQARIDYPGLTHHVIVRGLNGQALFLDIQDYDYCKEKNRGRCFYFFILIRYSHA